MSTSAAPASRPTRWAPNQIPDRRLDEGFSRIEVVTTKSQRRARPRTVYAIVSVFILLGIVLAQLLLSIAMSQGAYQINSLQTTTKQLQRSYQIASEDLDRLSSPQNLAANANALGMVADSDPVYLRLSDGAVLGTPVPAAASNGTVTGSQGNLVPNSLLAGIPLVTSKANTTPPLVAAPPIAATPSAPESGTAAPNVPLGGALPSPVTH